MAMQAIAHAENVVLVSLDFRFRGNDELCGMASFAGNAEAGNHEPRNGEAMPQPFPSLPAFAALSFAARACRASFGSISNGR